MVHMPGLIGQEVECGAAIEVFRSMAHGVGVTFDVEDDLETYFLLGSGTGEVRGVQPAFEEFLGLASQVRINMQENTISLQQWQAQRGFVSAYAVLPGLWTNGFLLSNSCN